MLSLSPSAPTLLLPVKPRPDLCALWKACPSLCVRWPPQIALVRNNTVRYERFARGAAGIEDGVKHERICKPGSESPRLFRVFSRGGADPSVLPTAEKWSQSAERQGDSSSHASAARPSSKDRWV